jgi:hypothetical protein
MRGSCGQKASMISCRQRQSTCTQSCVRRSESWARDGGHKYVLVMVNVLEPPCRLSLSPRHASFGGAAPRLEVRSTRQRHPSTVDASKFSDGIKQVSNPFNMLIGLCGGDASSLVIYIPVTNLTRHLRWQGIHRVVSHRAARF